MLLGCAAGLLAGVAFTSVARAGTRPDVAIALVVGIPALTGLLTILFSGRRWVTTLGAFVLGLGPGWFGVLVALRVACGA
jgi:low temperature requirement protein LtrA